METQVGNENATPIEWSSIRRDWKRLVRGGEPTDDQIRSFVRDRGGWIDETGYVCGWILVNDGDGSTWCDEAEIRTDGLNLFRFATPDSPRRDEDGRVLRTAVAP